MADPQIDENFLAEISHRLELREPNRKAIESVVLRSSMHYDVDGESSTFECIVDSATGVGKTYVMAGLIEYLAGVDSPSRNFLLLAPGRTIRDKSVRNFTPGHAKSLTSAMGSRPMVVTADNFTSPSVSKAMTDPTITKLYIFTVQALTSVDGDGRETHEFQERLGGSFYEHLSTMPDLVVLADEHHCYRGKAFSRTIRDLNPRVVVGLTATPAKGDEGLIAYRYPLAAAIADRLVKIPVVVGRRDDRSDAETKLLDGVTLLRYKAQVANAYCAENDLPPVNPVMLVIASNIEEANEFREVVDSASFDGGDWVGTTLLVHSGLTGDVKEQALADLDAVEDPSSLVRVIISVGMLKEGWDVKNVYVIASMRASVSDVLTEQTLGRGMRLPFGRYTDVEILDTVEVLAHERYEQLLAKRKALNEKFIDYGTYAKVRELADGSKVVRQEVVESTAQVIADPEQPMPTGDYADQGFDTSVVPGLRATGGVADVKTRQSLARGAAGDSVTVVEYSPLTSREPIVIPLVVSVATSASVSLNDIDVDDYGPFAKLGEALTTEFKDDLRRTKITAKRESDWSVTTSTEAAKDKIASALVLDIPLATTRADLLRRVMAVPGVAARASELGAAERIVDHVIAAMGKDASTCLSAHSTVCGRRLAEAVGRQLAATAQSHISYTDGVELVTLNKVRRGTRKQMPSHADGSFAKSVAFNGWARNLYSHAWFDSEPEFKAANAIDDGQDVVVWAKLHINDLAITWTGSGRRYNPDFVVIEDTNDGRRSWLVETKADRDISTAEVVDKRKAARRWANVVNSSMAENTTWRYLLLSEQDVADAKGSWESMKVFGS